MIPFLPYSSEKVNANFLSLGVFLPLLLFHYRLLLWYSDLYTLFNPASCSPALCRFLEPLALCYLPTFLLFFLIREKNHLFFCKVCQKIPLFSQYFYALTKGEIFLCKNPLLGCFLLMLFILFYLFLVYSESFFMHFRILLLLPYLSFRLSLLKEDNFVVRNYPGFLEVKQEMEEPRVKEVLIVFSLFCSLFNLVLYRLDTIRAEDVRFTEKRCDKVLLGVKDQIGSLDYNQIVEEKEEVFQSYRRKPFLYKASLFFFHNKQQRSDIIYKKIEKLSQTLSPTN